MINSFCDALRTDIDEALAIARESLEHGTASRDADERLRGEIWGLRKALDIVDALEERARKQNNETL